MRFTKELPSENTPRTRRVFAILPQLFEHGSINNPMVTIIWLEYYLIHERYTYGRWRFLSKEME